MIRGEFPCIRLRDAVMFRCQMRIRVFFCGKYGTGRIEKNLKKHWNANCSFKLWWLLWSLLFKWRLDFMELAKAPVIQDQHGSLEIMFRIAHPYIPPMFVEKHKRVRLKLIWNGGESDLLSKQVLNTKCLKIDAFF